MTDKEYAQKKDGWCGPAALSFALSQVNIDVPQEQIAKDTKTSESKGVDPGPFIEAAKKYGAKVETISGRSQDKTLTTLIGAVKDGASVIVDYLVSGDEDGGHYVVFLGQHQGKIRIWNPSGGKKDLLDKQYFVENWKDRTEGGKELENWAMVIRA